MPTSWSESDLKAHYDALKTPVKLADHQELVKRSKYGVDTSDRGKSDRTVDGILFASLREAQVYVQLKVAQQAGAISDLVLQPYFELLADFIDSSGRKVKGVGYKADFKFCEGETIEVIDVKSKATRTTDYVIRSKWFRWKFPQYIFEEWD